MIECVRRIVVDMKKAGKDFVTKEGKALEDNKILMFVLARLLNTVLPPSKEEWGGSKKQKPILEWPRTKAIVGPGVKGCQYDQEIVGEVGGGMGEGRYMIGRNVWLMEKPIVGDEEWDDESSSDEEDSDDSEIMTISAKSVAPKKINKVREDMKAINGPYSRRKRSANLISSAKSEREGLEEKANGHANDSEAIVRRVRRPPSVWDPTGILPFLEYDPFMTVICEICRSSGDDSRLLICDKCELGYHMYCCKPIIAKVPVGDWLCKNCQPNVKDEKKSFERRLEKMIGEEGRKKAASFLKLSDENPELFYTNHPNLAAWVEAKNDSKRKKKFTYKIGRYEVDGFFLSAKQTKDVNMWNLPEPPTTASGYVEVATRLAAACMECGMTEWSNDLVYRGKASRRMNDATLDEVGSMSQVNTSTYKMFKENMEKGMLPPLSVDYDPDQGFVVKATQDISDKTLLLEYTGAVTRIKDSGKSNSDSLMILLQTDSPKTSLIIDPSAIGNMARFLSGVNNNSVESRKRINVRTRRFQVDGECRVVLFSNRKIHKGERLSYDYNAGIINSNMGEAQTRNHGFYDTSHFS